jgi:hypothetical protein
MPVAEGGRLGLAEVKKETALQEFIAISRKECAGLEVAQEVREA